MNAKTNAESSITDQGNRARRLLSCFVIFLTISILLNSSVFTSYASQTTPVIKIGFPNQAGSSYIDERGNYAGYLVDYLHQLDMFTDWDIEFIQVEGDSDTQLSTLMDMLMDGEIDIMGTMNRNTQLEEFFLYPNYSYGTSYTTLAVLDDDLRWIEDDCANWNDIRVATYPGYESRMKEFRYYAQANRFTYEVVECDSYDDMAQAVRNGEADAMIQSDLSLVNGFRVIGRFSPAPYYFAVSKDNTDLLQQLDSAMRSLNSSQPNLQSELYDLYFRHTGEFQISQSHLDYIHSLGTLKVLFFDGNAPYQYINKEGKLTGFVVEYWKNFADATGLQYEPVIVSTYPEAVELIENGQIDIVACVPTNSTLSSLDAVRFSLPYFNSFSVSAYPDSKSHKPSSDLKFRTNTEIALNEIQHEDKNGVQLDYYSLSFYLRKDSVYDSVAVDWSDTKNFSYVSGITGDVPDDFVTILNQYITSVKDDTMQTLLYRYSSDDIEYTFSEWIYSHRILIACALAVTIILACLCWITWRNNRLRYKTLLAENRLAQLTMYDSTTGAYNESQFRKLLEECCKKKENIALIALNIRGFKYINDTYGTKRADEVLCDIKDILESEIDDGEFFCRPSADMFYLALKEKNSSHLLSRTDDIFSRIIESATGTLDGHPLSLYSGAVFIGDSPTPYCVSSNISYMMVALAHAKHENCHKTHIFDHSLYQTKQLLYYIETHMQSALEHGEYLLYLQPKMNFQTGRIDSAEALVRWKPANREMLYPNQFIPFFEENGFCAQLDLYMIEQVCKTLRSWMDSGIPPLVISVNQSKSLFVKDEYVDSLLRITEKYHISPQYIILEILEGLSFENISALNNTIQKLNRAGFRVSMDDFGTGYSSLNTLGKLEINELKLDREFLMDVMNDPKGTQSIVLASVLSLAKKLGIKTVAEGVETKESEDVIRSMCCDYGQGYYYSKPIPAEDFRQRFCLAEFAARS